MYKIKLQVFEGPLDLLLFFIKRDEIDIYDIPISKITKEFVEYLEFLKELDLESAGDFILMASTLMQIKVRMLLPKEIDEKGEEIDPRADLVNALLEYKRFKEMTDELSFFESNQRKLNYRGNYTHDAREEAPELDLLLKNVTIYDLIKSFKKALMERPREAIHEIEKINVSIEQQIEFILNLLEDNTELPFIELVKDLNEKMRIIVTFIALLELVKLGKIGLRESEKFNDFVIFGINDG
ncbi:MAG: segregation/condensation protein A [Ignavibacteriae bacterium]|nr:segregation/condensation protein A [Ignavibacteriota bacterium]NOG96587.1 segregation/condensation protein A [Ignavibacteriota bacterium]